MSSYRFVRHAATKDKAIFIVNIGVTRGDALAHVKLSNRCTDVLERLRF